MEDYLSHLTQNIDYDKRRDYKKSFGSGPGKRNINYRDLDDIAVPSRSRNFTDSRKDQNNSSRRTNENVSRALISYDDL